jgi:Glucose / Sorbosone dehydrogenase
MIITRILAGTLCVASLASQALAQPIDPFPKPIPATEDAIKVSFTEFASLPDIDGEAARMMLLIDEPGTRRLFVNDMRGILYSVSYDGKSVAPYLDLRIPRWSLDVLSVNFEQGIQSFAFHPQFATRGAPGFGKLYTYVDTSNIAPPPDFKTSGPQRSHDTILLEWTATDPAAASFDGGPPRELLRFQQPFQNHNGGHITFNPLAVSGDADFGLLYVGCADGGSGNDPFRVGQDLSSAFGKILRIDPLGKNSTNGKYGIPPANPFVSDGKAETLGEIYAYGVRNPQRFFWDSKTRQMFFSDIGQNLLDEISPVTAGANLGWNAWEASYRFDSGSISTENPRSDPKMTYPVVEYGHIDPLFHGTAAIIGGAVYRQGTVGQLKDLMIFGDNPSGEVFYVHADKLPQGGQDAIRRILFNQNGEAKTLLQLVQDKNTKQGKQPTPRADLRFGYGPAGQLFVLNEHDGVIRLLVAN